MNRKITLMALCQERYEGMVRLAALEEQLGNHSSSYKWDARASRLKIQMDGMTLAQASAIV